MKTQYLVNTSAALGLALGALAQPAWAVTNLSACGDITKPGSYRLTRSVTAAPEEDCFVIRASGVTLDLGGHTVTGNGVSPSSLGSPTGVRLGGDRTTVRNGTIEQFQGGIGGGFGAALTGLTVKDNLGDGINVDGGTRIQGNTVTGNGGTGIAARSGALITDNDVENNGDGLRSGIIAEAGSELRGNRASFNVRPGIIILGIGGAGTVSENDVEDNGRNGINAFCPWLILDNKVLDNNALVLGGQDIRTTPTAGRTCTLSGNHQ